MRQRDTASESFSRRLLREDLRSMPDKVRLETTIRAARILAAEQARGQKVPSWLAHNADLWGLEPRQTPRGQR